MLRTLGIPALLVAVVVGLYLSAKSMQSNGPTSSAGQQAITQANSEAAATDFSQADEFLQGFYAQSGTYAGAALPPGTGVVLARADATSYCLQSGNEHENGPGGQPQPGAC
jgi:hypothetical protein